MASWWQQPQPQQAENQPQQGGSWWRVQKPVPESTEIPIPEKPFMAEGVDDYGLPFYGSGLKGWARGTFAKIFDPKHQIANIENAAFAEKARSEAEINKYAQQFNQLTRWDEWGEKLFGISSKDFGAVKAASVAEIEDAEARGESKLGTILAGIGGDLARGAVQVGMSVLGMFGALDYIKRKDIMISQATYELAQDSDLYRAAKENGVPEWLLSRGPEWEVPIGKNGKHIDGGFWASNPIVGVFLDPAKYMRTAFQLAAVLADKDTRGQYLPTVQKYWQGSGMAYTMVSDAQKRQMFIDAVNNGDDPALAAANYGNFWTELAGSFLNDPSTYLGMTIIGKGSSVVKIPFTNRPLTIAGKELRVPWQKIGEFPTFGELIGIGAKVNRTSAATKAVSAVGEVGNELFRMDEVKNLMKGMDGITDETLAKGKLNDAFSKIIDGVDAWDANLTKGKMPNIRTLATSSVKASQMSRNVTNAIRQVAASGGTIDDVLERMVNLRTIFKGASRAERMKAAALAVRTHGELAVSDSYLQLGKFLARFEDDADIAKLLDTTGGQPSVLFDPIAKKIQAFAEQFYPSMDEMADASRMLSDKAEEIAKAERNIADLEAKVAKQLSFDPKSAKAISDELDKAKKAFDADFGRARELKAMYDNINPYMRVGREMLRKYEKIFHRPMKLYMDTVFLGLRPAQYMKQLQSQTALIAMDLGFVDALSIFKKTITTSFSDTWTVQMIQRNADDIKKVLGFVPEAMTRGVTAAGETRKGFGFLRVSGNLDMLMSSEIMLRMARREMEKVLQNSDKMFNYDALSKVFTPDEVHLVKSLMRETNGNVDEVVAELAKVASDGKIESWRHIPMPPALKEFTQNTKLYENFIELQRTAKTRDEFVKGVDNLIAEATEQARKGAVADPPVVDEMMNETVREDFVQAQDLVGRGLMDEGEALTFNNMVNAYEYMRRNVEMGIMMFKDAVIAKMSEVGLKPPQEFFAAAQRINNVVSDIHSVYPEYNKVASQVRDVLRLRKNLSSLERAQLLDNARFDVVKMTGKTVEELGALPKREFEKVVWSAYFHFAGQYWKGSNMRVLDQAVQSIDDLARAAAMTPEEILASSGELRDVFRAARKYQQQAAVWENQVRYTSKSLGQVANAYGIPTISETGVPINKTIVDILNKNLPEGVKPFTDYKDAQERLDDARLALARWSRTRGGDEAEKASAKIGQIIGDEGTELVDPKAYREIPPVSKPGTATGAQEMYEHLTDAKFTAEFQAWKDMVTEQWGTLKATGRFDDLKKTAVQAFRQDTKQKMEVIRAKISAVATAQRDDILLSYDRNMGDLALAYLKPYHYWQTRQYVKMFERFLDHPSWANAYLKYKEAMAKEHADLPEWWRYNIPIKGMFGVEFNHPLYINLESAINPIYDLTGVDFNDPYRRVDWVSRLVDDLGKTGGTFSPMLQWLVAMHLYQRGEEDAATRWMGRLFGQAGTAVKSGLTAAGFDINIGKFVQHNEIDPFVNFLSGGVDPNERKRIGRYISGLVMQGKITEEQAIDAMYSQSGELYERAKIESVQERSGAELISFFLGVNWKPRTERDQQIDQFYQEYSQLRAQASLMPPEQYRQAWDLLREKYEFMDAVLLSGKATPDRDSAFAYNVLGRLPPGTADDVLRTVGITNDDIQKFYDSKGFNEEYLKEKGISLSPQERDRFMAAVVELSAMLSVPPLATKQEWNVARTEYGKVYDAIEAQFGKDIWDKVSVYYDLRNDKSNPALYQEYQRRHPEVMMALQAKGDAIYANPILAEYYGSIDKLESYFDSKQKMQLLQEFGDLTELQAQYFDLRDVQNNKAAARALLQAHPELLAYWKRKKELTELTTRAYVEFAAKLPEADPLELRSDFDPENASSGQLAMLQALQTNNVPTWDELITATGGQMSPAMQTVLQAYWMNGEPLSKGALKQLDYLASRYGAQFGVYDATDLLRLTGVILMQEQGQVP